MPERFSAKGGSASGRDRASRRRDGFKTRLYHSGPPIKTFGGDKITSKNYWISFTYLRPIFLLFLIVSTTSCVKAPPPLKHFPEANQRFLQLCQEEYQLTPITQRVDGTLWIYVPIEKSFLDYKGTPEGPSRSNQGKEKFSILYVDGQFKDDTFHIEYDIAKTKSYPVDFGYKSSYSEEFQKMQSHLLTAAYRAYADLEKSSEEKPLTFIVIVIADVTRGVEMESLFSLEDLKFVQTGALPPEEFQKRDISELRGQETIIGDTTGRHLDLKDITWPEFLSKQILNRIRFQYQHSDFPPTDGPQKELIAIAAETLKAYDFNHFESIELKDLADGKSVILEKSKLATFIK